MSHRGMCLSKTWTQILKFSQKEDKIFGYYLIFNLICLLKIRLDTFVNTLPNAERQRREFSMPTIVSKLLEDYYLLTNFGATKVH